MKLECSYVQLPKIYRHLSGNELKVFVTMFDQWSMMKNEDGWYYRSQKQLCEDTGLTDRTLRDIIKKFVEKGVIFTTTYNDGVKMATYNKANEYKINMKKVVEMSKEKVVKKVKEGGNFYHPSKNIITKEKNKIYNINNKTSKDITPDVETLQDKKVNNDLKLIDMKENEMSDNGTNVMNDNEQGRSNASESDTINEMTTSTSGDKNKTSKEFQNIPVDNSKVENNDCNVQGVIPNAKDCAPAPATEEWKPVVGYEDLYEVSNLGRVKRLARWFKTKGESEQWRKELIVTPTLNEKGYQRVELYDIDGKRKKYRVHRLVAEAFIPNPYNLPQVNHKDENKTNNVVSNLEWCNCQYNIDYSLSKPVIQYRTDGTIVNTYNSISQAVRETGYSEQTITKSCKGYNTFGHKWKYVEPSAWDEDAIFGLQEPQNVSGDKLSTQGKKTQPEPQECPQNETDVFNRISEILEEALGITDVEPFKAKLQEALDLLKQIRPSANRNAFTRCCNDTIYWYTQNNWDDWDMFSVASDFKRDIERMKRA